MSDKPTFDELKGMLSGVLMRRVTPEAFIRRLREAEEGTIVALNERLAAWSSLVPILEKLTEGIGPTSTALEPGPRTQETSKRAKVNSGDGGSEQVHLTITIPLAELPGDEPEIELEEPLDDALADSNLGEITGSGTEPDNTFNINVTVQRDLLAKALRMIRRVLIKRKCPASTVIIEEANPPVHHALSADPHSTGKLPGRKS